MNILFLDDAPRGEGSCAFESAGWIVVRAPYGAKPPDLSEIDLSVIAVHHSGSEAAFTSAQAVRNQCADMPLLFQIDEDAQETIERFSDFALAQIVSAAAGAGFQMAAARAALRQAEAQRTIAQHAAHWQKALEGSQQGVWNWNAQTNQTYFSPQWKAMLGYGDDEISNQLSEWETRVHPDDLPATQAAIQLHLDGQVDFYENEHRLRCKDGSYKWILDCGKVVERSPDGAVLHLAGTHHDITARKQAELERARLATRFQTLYRQSPIGIEIYDANGLLVDQNAVCLEIFGVVEPSELPGFSLFDDPNIPTSARAALHGGATVSYQAPFDFERVKQHNLYRTTRSGQIWLEIVLSALKEEDGRISGYMAQVIDISERKQMEAQMQREGRHYARLMQTSRDAIHVLDFEGRLVEWNDAFLNHLGVSAEEAVLLNVADWDATWRGEELFAVLRGLIQNPKTFEARHRRKDGTILDVEITAAGFEQDGQPFLYASARDITERKRAEETLCASEERFRALYDQTNDAVFFIDLEGNHKSTNLRAAEMLGYTFAEVQQLSVRETSAELQPSLHTMDRLIAGEKIPVYERLFRKKNGEIFPVEINVELVRDANGSPIHCQSIVRDISQRKADEQALQLAHEQLGAHMAEVGRLQIELCEQAIHDHLTGLYNRRYLDEMLSREMERAGRDEYPLCIIVADIDHFKRINDTFGHLTGDRFLVEYTQLIQHCMRGSDFVFRYGGEEFLLLLPGTTLAAAEKRADEIREKCAQFCLEQDGKTIATTISMGLAAFPEHSLDTEDLIMQADKALYRSKQAGRNLVTVWSEAIVLSTMG
jgi:diguanylate cyclase (GGDEF)-like protein/PAS domain S-box-containing protein